MTEITEPTPIELDLTFEAEEVKPGTSYEDEPDEMVRPGHWIRGFESEASTAEFQMRVPVIYNVNGTDVTEHFARMLADFLNNASNPKGDVTLRMTPKVARDIHDTIQFGYRTARDNGDLGNDESPGSFRAGVIGVLTDLDGQLKSVVK